MPDIVPLLFMLQDLLLVYLVQVNGVCVSGLCSSVGCSFSKQELWCSLRMSFLIN